MQKTDEKIRTLYGPFEVTEVEKALVRTVYGTLKISLKAIANSKADFDSSTGDNDVIARAWLIDNYQRRKDLANIRWIDLFPQRYYKGNHEFPAESSVIEALEPGTYTVFAEAADVSIGAPFNFTLHSELTILVDGIQNVSLSLVGPNSSTSSPYTFPSAKSGE